MKRTIFILLFTFLFTQVAYAVENPWNKKLPIKEGLVVYEISGTMSGNEEVYIKDYGTTIAAYRTEISSMFGVSDKTRELTLTTPDWVYTIDLTDNTGNKQMNPKKIIKEKFAGLSKAEQKKLVKNSEEMGITMVGEMSGDVEKNVEKMFGYKCDKVTMMGISSYTLAGTDFPMKISGNLMGMTFSEAVVKIDKGSVDEARFALPAGADIYHDSQGDQMVRNQINMMFTAVLAGERPVSRHDQANAEVQEAMRMMQQFQEGGSMEDVQKQFEGMFGGAQDNQ